MAQQIGIDGALLDAQAETRGENILKLHPEESGVQFFGFHRRILEKRKQTQLAVDARRGWQLAAEKPGSKNPPQHGGAACGHFFCVGAGLYPGASARNRKERTPRAGVKSPATTAEGGARRT